MSDSRLTASTGSRSEKLVVAEIALEQEMHRLQHDLRWVKDGLERVGGVSYSLDQKARQLKHNIHLCEIDLKENRRQQSSRAQQPVNAKNKKWVNSVNPRVLSDPV